MLSAKPWKADAIIRLGLSVIVCVFAGLLVLSVHHYVGAGAKVSPGLFFPLVAAAFGGLAATLVFISKPWSPETFSRRLVTSMAYAWGNACVVMLVQQLSEVALAGASIWRVVVPSLSFHGLGLILIARFLREHQVCWAEAFGFLNQRRRAMLMGLLVTLIFLPVGWGLREASAFVMTHMSFFRLQPEEQLPVHVLRVSLSWTDRITLGATAVLLAPVTEEMLFRGILYPAVKQLGYPRLALWATSLLFAYVHMNLVSFVPLTVLALVLTALYERTNNLLAPITAHMLFNALNFVMLLLLQQRGEL